MDIFNLELLYMIQSVLFDKKLFSRKQAIDKLLNRGFKFNKIHETENYYRFRQYDPKEGERFRIVGSGPGIKYVYSIK